MRKARVGLLVAAVVALTPLTALAQQKGQPAKGAQPAAGQGEKEINLDEPQGGTPAGGQAGEEPAGTGTEGPEEGGGICDITPEVCEKLDFKKLAERPLSAEMYAVQQIYALRYRRFEVGAYGAVTMNDQFVTHPGGGLSVNWYISNVLAVGVNGNIYGNAVSAFNFQTGRSARVGLPITEYQWNANFNFSYVPAYGKFAGFGDFIFHYDFYVVGGVGAISTRPIAVIDPDNRVFQFEPKIDFRVGLGVRVFFNRWFAATLEISDYIFFDQLENANIASGQQVASSPECGASDRGDAVIPSAQCPKTWVGDSSFTNNVQAQVGLAFFLPPTWEYRLPK